MNAFAQSTAGVSNTILVVDDEELLREYLGTVLEYMGYKVLTAADGVMALTIYRSRFQEIDLVVTDVVMPGMHGWEVVEAMKDINGELKAVVMSGYDEFFDGTRNSENIIAKLRKPFHIEELASILARGLAAKSECDRIDTA